MFKQTMIALAGAAATLAGFAVEASAFSLAGDSVQVEIRNPLGQVVGSSTGVVGPDGVGTDLGIFGGNLTFDFNAGPEGDIFKIFSAANFGGFLTTSGGFTDFTLSSLNFGSGKALVGFELISENIGPNGIPPLFTIRNLTADSVTFRLLPDGLTLPAGELLSARFIPQDQPGSTPIPTPALLPGLIGMGIAALRKKGREEEVVGQEA